MGHFGYPAVQRSRERSERQDEQGLARGSFSKNASAASVFAERQGYTKFFWNEVEEKFG